MSAWSNNELNSSANLSSGGSEDGGSRVNSGHIPGSVEDEVIMRRNKLDKQVKR